MFEKTGGGDVNLQDLIKGDDRLVSGKSASDNVSPLLQYWDPDAGYKMFYFLQTAVYDKKAYKNVWSKSTSAYDPNVTVDVGRGVWFHPIADCTITVAGQVAEVAGKTKTVYADKWNLIANPYPTEFVINGGKVDWAAAGFVSGKSAADNVSPLIQYWDPDTGYKMFYYLQTAVYDKKAYKNVWSKSTSAYDPNAAVPAGYGFWIYGTKAMFGNQDSIDLDFSL